MKRLILITIFFVFANSLFGQSSKNEIVVTINKIRNNKGQIMLALYTAKKQFTDNAAYRYKVPKANMQGDYVTYTIKGLKPGIYAFTLLDDENLNNDIDFNFIGIPQEGYGFSNNARPKLLSAPDWEDCIFKHDGKHTEVVMGVQYF